MCGRRCRPGPHGAAVRRRGRDAARGDGGRLSRRCRPARGSSRSAGCGCSTPGSRRRTAAGGANPARSAAVGPAALAPGVDLRPARTDHGARPAGGARPRQRAGRRLAGAAPAAGHGGPARGGRTARAGRGAAARVGTRSPRGGTGRPVRAGVTPGERTAGVTVRHADDRTPVGPTGYGSPWVRSAYGLGGAVCGGAVSRGCRTASDATAAAVRTATPGHRGSP